MKIVLGGACDCDSRATLLASLVEYDARINGMRDVFIRSITAQGITVCDYDESISQNSEYRNRPTELLPWAQIDEVYVY